LGRFLADALPPWSLSSLADALPPLLLDILSLVDALPPRLDLLRRKPLR
jgi:hypothetical protein